MVAVALLLMVAIGGVVAYKALRPTGPSFPKAWDPRVADIAAFDEKERGLTYKHPVTVEFMAVDDFVKTVTTSSGDLTDKDKKEIEATEGTFRSLGLIDGSVDLLQQENDLQGGGTLAYYSPKTKVVRVRGTELTPATKVTLAHELTHVLQDQYFDLDKTEKGLPSDGARNAYRAVAEGDAVGVEHAYRETLSKTDQDAYDKENAQQGSDANYDKAPQVLVANFTYPYVLGPPFVAALKAKGGTTAVDQAEKDPPQSEASVIDIFAFLRGDKPLVVGQPALEDGQEKLDDGDFGAITWYLMLARRLDAHDAVKAVDGWGGDSFVSYKESSGRICVRARYQGRTSDDTAAMKTLLDRWVAAGSGAPGTVDQVGDVVQLSSCDPGSSATQSGTDQSAAALELLGVRLQVDAVGFEQHAPDKVVACSADGLIARLTLDDVTSNDEATSTKVQRSLADAIAACK